MTTITNENQRKKEHCPAYALKIGKKTIPKE
jgi:hypothetical protein